MSTLSFISQDPFFAVPQSTTVTSQGPVQLPILYHQVRNLNAFFMVERGRVQRALDQAGATDLQPACLWRDRALVAFACYEYTHTSIGPYNEIGVAVPVVAKGQSTTWRRWLETLSAPDAPGRQLGYFVLHLPVNTDVACAAGREIWGLPKFVAPIHYGREARRVDIQLHDPEARSQDIKVIAHLHGDLRMGLPAPSLSPLLYSQQGGGWLQTTVNVRGAVRLCRGAGMTLKVGASSHPMASTLRSLALDGARPWLVTDTDRFQSQLHAGKRMLPV